MSGIGVVIFVIAILFSIGLHEFGHFITAKKFGMKVHSFYVGFRPAIWSKQVGETEYGIGAIPIGGFVKIAGMNPFEDIAPEDRDRVFKAKKPWQRAIVLSAGSFTHFLLAFVIIAVVLATAGLEDFNKPTTTVGEVSKTVQVGDGEQQSPAAKAGLHRGDKVVAVDGSAVGSWTQLVDYVRAHPNQTVRFTIIRDGRQIELTPTTTTQSSNGQTYGFIGIGSQYARDHYSVPRAIGTAGIDVGKGIWESAVALKQIFSPSSIAHLFKIVGGTAQRKATDPTTIVGIGGQAGSLFARGDIGLLFLLIASFNIFVGLANIIPLPPLDGGHLAVLAYEKVRGRDVDMRKLIPISAAVIAAFASLFLILLYLDVVNPVPKIPG
ncbi:MAG: RIP metalloprotease [Actinomycetota bacterium]|nr:M50 family metallopeptidase [Actinomycetota bacterium]